MEFIKEVYHFNALEVCCRYLGGSFSSTCFFLMGKITEGQKPVKLWWFCWDERGRVLEPIIPGAIQGIVKYLHVCSGVGVRRYDQMDLAFFES